MLPSTFTKLPRTQEQYKSRSIEPEKEQEGEPERKSGSDEKRFLPIAREVLEVTNPSAPIKHLLDAFFNLRPIACSRAEATRALNLALSERRTSHA